VQAGPANPLAFVLARLRGRPAGLVFRQARHCNRDGPVDAPGPPRARDPQGRTCNPAPAERDWSLASQVAEPLKMTTSVYNGQQDPLNSNAILTCAPASALL